MRILQISSKLLLLALTLALALAMACADSKKKKFMPANNLDLQDDVTISINVQQQEFYDSITQVQNVYNPIVESFGAELLVRGDWFKSTVNASASRTADGTTWIIDMFGGLARRSEVTKDGFILVLCHEMGHHLAGFPFVQEWASNEGQSDYFSTYSCARLLWLEDKEINALFKTIVPPIPKGKCNSVWLGDNDRNLCYRIMVAAKSTANLLAALQNSYVSFEEEDSRVVNQTIRLHPFAQCRLDTFIAGGLCTNEFNSLFIPGLYLTEAEGEAASNLVTCNRKDDYQIGSRPRCWYKPNLP